MPTSATHPPDNAEDQPTPPSTQTEPLQSHNPYTAKKSYKDALLAEVESATNRLGVDTFKLMHLLHTKKRCNETGNTDDGGSISSADTQAKTNGPEWYTSRMRFQITLPETTQETFMDDLSQKVNQVLEVINLNTPGVKLAPWHVRTVKKEDLRTELSDDMMEAIKYLYGFKAGMSRPGTQYF
jgi:hypothetical protein